MTTIEKVILGVIVLMVIGLAVIIPSAVRDVRNGVNEVKAIGLKGVVEKCGKARMPESNSNNDSTSSDV